MLLGPCAGDLVTEPRDHVGRRGTLRIGRPGERPRRRRIVPAGHRGEPLRLAHRARSFELVEGTKRVGRGPDPATRAAHAEPAGFDGGHVDRGRPVAGGSRRRRRASNAREIASSPIPTMHTMPTPAVSHFAHDSAAMTAGNTLFGYE